MRWILYLLFCLPGTTAVAQGNMFDSSDSWQKITNATIKNETALFTRKGIEGKAVDHNIPFTVSSIRLVNCSDSFAVFEKGDLYASRVLVHVEARGPDQDKKISEVAVIFYKVLVRLPDSAIANIYHPRFCNEPARKKKPRFTSDCKVFESADKRRVYIYMLNGEESNRYEITWVLEDHKYLTRIIDLVP